MFEREFERAECIPPPTIQFTEFPLAPQILSPGAVSSKLGDVSGNSLASEWTEDDLLSGGNKRIRILGVALECQSSVCGRGGEENPTS